MARTYTDIQQEIATLRRAADSARQKEVSQVIAGIKAAIRVYGLTAHDLGLGGATASEAAGRRWSGRGRRPAWVNEALAAGRSLEELRA